ncbi:MAG: hypothetical protein NZ601_06475, partial [candidate division WOR-3 bacterium]|nr:hypothetical protein [candidate division WOR-3 bacterium]
MILINAILYLFLSNSFFKTERFPDIEVIKSDGNGITFRYLISENNIREEKVFVENRIYTTFIIEGAFYKEPIGSFDLPSREIFIGLPQSGDVSISAKAVKSKKVTNIEILPVPYKSWDRAPIYEIKDTVSKPLCEISTISWFRDNRIARLKINPIQYNFSYKEAIINTEIFVEIKFTSPAIDNYYHDYFDSVGADFILNWEIAKRWKKFQESKSFDYGMCKYPPGFTNWYKIQIESTGVYKISYNELKRAGIPVNIIDPRTIRIFNIGDYIPNVYYPDTLTEIPIYVAGENDGRLDKNDYILFFGVSPSRFSKDRSKFYTNPFTKYNYYWLTWGISLSFSGPGKRYTTIPSVTGGVPIYSAND